MERPPTLAAPPPRAAPGGGWRPDTRWSAVVTAMLWLLTLLMIVPEGFDYASIGLQYAPSAGSPASRALWLALLGFGALAVLSRARLGALLGRWTNPFLFLFGALAIASVAWSIDPIVTIRRDVRFVTIVLCGAAFALVAWHRLRFQQVLRPVLTAVLAGSIVFGLAAPPLAIHAAPPDIAGAWHGLANHKNGLGAIACLTLLLWFHGWLAREVTAWRAIGGAALALACLLLSRSTTSLVAALLLMAFMWTLLRLPRGLQPYAPWVVGSVAALLLLYALALLRIIPGLGILLAPVMALSGKDATLTGRSEIWAILSDHIDRHPLLGTGYGAYWTGPVPGTDSYEFILRLRSFYPGSAHSGYLEVLNDLGWAGLLCLIGYLAVHVWQSLRLLRIDRSQAVLFLGIFVQQAITNLAESHWLSVLSVDFVLMTLCTFALGRQLLDQRLRETFGDPLAPARSRAPPRRRVHAHGA